MRIAQGCREPPQFVITFAGSHVGREALKVESDLRDKRRMRFYEAAVSIDEAERIELSGAT